MASSFKSASTSAWLGRLPAGGLLAVALVVAFEVALPTLMPWREIEGRIPSERLGALGLVRDRIVFDELEQLDSGLDRAFVIGTSRAQAAFDPVAAPDAFAQTELVALAHPGMMPFEMRSAIDEVLRHEPAAVAFALSDFETTHPMRLRAQLSSGSPSAVLDLVAAGGVAHTFERRVDVLRLALASASAAYRYRDVARDGLFLPALEFPTRPRHRGRPDRERHAWRRRATAAEVEPARQRLEREAYEILPHRRRFLVRIEVEQLLSFTPGDQVRIQQELLRRAIARLRAAGVRVALVELPNFPGASGLYDPNGRIRADFLAFAATLVEDHQVVFLPLEEGNTYDREDFNDLVHLTGAGREKMTRSILDAIARALDVRHDADGS